MEKRIAGPYDPFYPEVTRKLRDTVSGYLARWIYQVLVTLFYVEEEWGDDPVWAHGIVHATGAEVAREAAVPPKSFYRAWKKLADAGIVKEREDGAFLLLYYKKKGYDSMSAREIRELNAASVKRISKLEGFHADDPDGPGGEEHPNCPQNEAKRDHLNPKSHHEDDKCHHEDDSSSFLKAFTKNSLSSLNTVISGFYKGIGQKQISRKKRERGLNVGKKLRKEGFSLEDIAFAAHWTVENAEKQPYDFALIEDTIGQALAARDKIGSERQAIEERDKVLAEESAKLEREELERQEIETYKANLNQEEREEVRLKARAELIKTGVSASLIDDFLLDIKENEILRKYLEENPSEKGQGNQTGTEDKQE